MLCPKCYKQREPRERVEHKDGKGWLIEFCHHCGYNFELTEWEGPKKPPTDKKESPKPRSRRFGAFFRDDTERTDDEI